MSSAQYYPFQVSMKHLDRKRASKVLDKITIHEETSTNPRVYNTHYLTDFKQYLLTRKKKKKRRQYMTWPR